MDQILEKDRQGASAQSQELLKIAVAELRERFDSQAGSFAGLTEPQESGAQLFLLEYARRTGDGWARAMAEGTLGKRNWATGPMLAYAHLEAYAQTGRPACREAACNMLDGALAELRLFSGCFAQPGDAMISTAWNAQMIAGLSKAYRVLGELRYLRAAEKTWMFMKSRLTRHNGRLWRRWQDQSPLEEGRLADYGLCCWALVELYEANFSISCLREAEAMADRMADIFRDPRGGFYDVSDTSGCGAAGLALAKLARLTALERYRAMAEDQLTWRAGAGKTELDGLGLLGMVEAMWPRQELVCVSAKTPPNWLALVGEEYRLAALAKTPDNSWGLENVAPHVQKFPVPESGDRLYLCRDGVCESAIDGLLQLYQRLAPEGAAV